MASWWDRPAIAAADETSTTDPPFRKWRPAARTVAKAVVSDAATTPSYCSRDVRCAGLSSIDPAKHATPSRGPACSTARSTASKSVASRAMSAPGERAVVTTS